MVYDYGFRIYDPRISRFLSVDPLKASYPWYTPYQFAGNTPIWAIDGIDLDGLEWADADGNIINGDFTEAELKVSGHTTPVVAEVEVGGSGNVETIQHNPKTKKPGPTFIGEIYKGLGVLNREPAAMVPKIVMGVLGSGAAFGAAGVAFSEGAVLTGGLGVIGGASGTLGVISETEKLARYTSGDPLYAENVVTPGSLGGAVNTTLSEDKQQLGHAIDLAISGLNLVAGRTNIYPGPKAGREVEGVAAGGDLFGAGMAGYNLYLGMSQQEPTKVIEDSKTSGN